MNREDARKAAEVMIAYADGKEIECDDPDKDYPWYVIDKPSFNWASNNYRIKPTPTYRPFANAEECWEEMRKHEPFGWLIDKGDGHYISITRLSDTNEDGLSLNSNSGWSFENLIKFYTFADGTPFGKIVKD